ncbi:MAG TPA: histidine phosphatase family protein [Pyrinomonadaceae bacterium]
MKTLLLLRHARPSQTSPTGRDFDRPLIKAGRADARLVGQTFLQRNLAPGVILSSPAARARETIELVRASAGLDAAPRFDERLFNATPEQLLAVISALEDETDVLLLVAHNPGVAELITLLTNESATVSPGTLSRIDLDLQTWRDLQADSPAQLVFTLAPGQI